MAWPARAELPGWALATIGPTTAPTTNATATAAAQAGKRNTRRADDHDHIPRVTAHLLVTARAVEPAAAGHTLDADTVVTRQPLCWDGTGPAASASAIDC